MGEGDVEVAATRSGLDEAAVGRRVRSVRERRGRSLRALAGDLGISPSSLSAIENGHTRLTVTRLSAIARLLGVASEEVSYDIAIGPPRPFADAAGSETTEPGEPAGSAWMPGPGGWREYPPLRLEPPLAAALDEFLRAGYHGSSVRDIAVSCGLSVPGLYHRHESKQHLLRALLEYTMEDLLWRSRAARAEGRNPVERFVLVVECLALFHTHRRELGFIGASEMRSLEPGNRHHIASLRTRQQRMVDDDVLAGVALGRFRASRPKEASRVVVTMCTALPQWFDPAGSNPPEEIAHRYVDYALDVARFVRPPAARPGESAS